MKNKITFLIMLLFAVFSFNAKSQPGAIDLTFDPGTGANNYVMSTAVQNDGKIIIGGYFTSYNGTTISSLARLNTDGSIDGTFNSGTGPNNTVLSIAIQSDGKIIIGGWFTSYNGTARNYIARLNSNGSVDATFNPGTGANSVIHAIAIQSDGKIVIGGEFTSYNGTARNRIVRLYSDGSIDATFNPGTGANNNVYSTAIQSDGKIIIGGLFYTYNGLLKNYMARLNTDGSLDATFNASGGGPSGRVDAIVIQNDGKIIIVGWFSYYNGYGRKYIARINTDGSIDESFNPGTGANTPIYAVAIKNDGKIIIGGDFTLFNGTARNYLACLNIDGTIDASFNQGTGASLSVYAIAIQGDGKIIIVGGFTSYDGIARNRIARIFGCSLAPSQPSIITGSTTPCVGSSQNYSVTNVAGITYTWSFPAGWIQTGGGTTNDIAVTVGSGVGDITVTPLNECGNGGISRTLAVTPLDVPAQPSAITGSTTPCVGLSQNYSVTNIAGITYTWSFPTGWVQTGGGTTNVITVTVGTGSGNITVTPSNTCGNGTARTLAVTPTTVPAQPSTITGNITPYYGTSENYSVTDVAGVTYTWTFPTGWVQTGGGNTNAVTATVGIGSGDITCTPSNACGNGTARTLAVTVYGVGIKENNNNNGLIVYPNPTEGSVSLNFKGYSGDIKITINNVMGELIYTENLIADSDNFVKTIDMAKYPNGIYYIQVVNDGKAFVQKIVKL
jgi:uncharacterized delta-60 repeat protein